MKRLALALATTLAGSGCVVVDHCDTRNVTVDWSPGFDGPDAISGRTCALAGVSYVDIFFNGSQVVGPLANGHFPCADYRETVTGVGNGSIVVTVEGVAANGSTILYRDEGTVNATGCNDLGFTFAPAAGDVNFAYQFYSGTTLLPPGSQVCAGPWLWLSVFDRTVGAVTVLADANSNPQAYSCGGTFTIALPVGDYDLRWMEEHDSQANGYALLSEDCTDRAFTIGTSATTSVPVHLDVTATAAVCAP